MKEWFKERDYFTEETLQKIIQWTESDKINVITETNLDSLGCA
jgi:hypothetical protein